jgi:hypothetical protein
MKKKKQQLEEVVPCYVFLAFAMSVISSSQGSDMVTEKKREMRIRLPISVTVCSQITSS